MILLVLPPLPPLACPAALLSLLLAASTVLSQRTLPLLYSCSHCCAVHPMQLDPAPGVRRGGLCGALQPVCAVVPAVHGAAAPAAGVPGGGAGSGLPDVCGAVSGRLLLSVLLA